MNAFGARKSAFALLGATITLGGVLTAGSASAAGAATGTGTGTGAGAGIGTATGWRVFASVSVPSKSVLLGNIDVLGSSDAWVAGIVNDGEPDQGALLENWNGSSWRPVTLPAGDSARIAAKIPLVVVGASSSRDVWVFGEFGHFLRLRGGRWTHGLIPSFPRETFIDQVVAFSPCDIWVFALRATGSPANDTFKLRPFAERFDGRTWRQVTIPGRPSDGAFTVSAVSARDMWALTGTVTPGSGIYAKPRVLHWNGRSWRPVTIQPRRPNGGTVSTILAVGPDNVWVGGSRQQQKGGSDELAQHWNGKTWTTINPPGAATDQDYYTTSMTPDGHGGIWLLGSTFASPIPGAARVWDYNGGRWSAPAELSSRLLVWSIVAVPHSSSVWGIAGGPALVKGEILLYGPVPR
jgi:hypothetical protein